MEVGLPQAAETCEINQRCLADCQVVDVWARGTEREIRAILPPCLAVLTDGTVDLANAERSDAYAIGRPASTTTRTAWWTVTTPAARIPATA